MPDGNRFSGDVGRREEYSDSQGYCIGNESEWFSADGQTSAVSSLPASSVREATAPDRLCFRMELAVVSMRSSASVLAGGFGEKLFRGVSGVGEMHRMDVPMLPIVGNDAGRLFIEADDHAGLLFAGSA